MNTNGNKNTYVNGNVIYMNSRELVTKEQFAEKVIERLKAKLPENYKVRTNKVLKNNGLELTGLHILEEASNISPCIYLERYYEDYLQGISLEQIVSDIVRTYNYHKVPAVDISFLTNYEIAKNRISCKLVNAEKNHSLLEEVPHILIYDLAVVFKMDVEEFTTEQNQASVVVKNHISKIWDKTPEELFEIALENMKESYPAQILPMGAVLEEMGADDESLSVLQEEICSLYVCTNTKRFLGAVSILYPGLLEEFARKINSSFYILPSSIHECLFIPKDFGDLYTLKEMVRDVNRTMVNDDEILSDNVYLFDKELGAVVVC